MALLRWRATAPSGQLQARWEQTPLTGGKTEQGFTGGSFRPLRRPSSTSEFSGQKTRKYREVWRTNLWNKFCPFFGKIFLRFTKKNIFRFTENIFWEKQNFFLFFENFFEKNRKNRKKHEKMGFSRKRPMTRISREWCRFFVKRWDLEHLFGGGGYPHFSEYTKDTDPLFGGSFFDPFFHVFSWKKKIFGSKNFFREKKFWKNLFSVEKKILRPKNIFFQGAHLEKKTPKHDQGSIKNPKKPRGFLGCFFDLISRTFGVRLKIRLFTWTGS